MATLYGIGVGPGDKELLTVKAVKTIEKCDVIVAPSAEEGGDSIALETAREYIKPDTEIVIKHFPMGKKDRIIKALEAYEFIESKLKEGKNVAFLTIGDPYVYSTYSHMLNHLRDDGFEVKTIPGITSFCAAASLVDRTLVVGNENLVVMPASKVKEITDEKFIVVMKVYKKEEEVLDILEEKGFDYVYASRVGREGQLVLTDREEILKVRDYMSLIIASRN
ncbi:cobalt-factor II C(20)-methyltransferase [Clostridium butyricum]|jgi:precorrin-2/cobalt-factor-2 C20-methyltransferase|uniref:Cobalt-precorrin-2 C(20)-methyltransferase n=1 Tax=Clostridium butyricum TaxID=1492 RepID=A0A512TIF9_CLOBU|nr:cobalt-factor II C(20)-methyltransferase [Clostridium butyricum]MBZ5746878.1 cobalt-factor II C(20)-methyltransferase [Clostridium butyricum]MDK2828663.1 precorrin-2/cobalt-factor-2 C20-methyltransferase [Clostridium butyricum]MDU5722007.1 cobalt-factor II C(20)-methyltransferase [Clostridium butyricum]MDU5820293.1 cobalt-factor II C(20)-methyltransferase [Clostridium butyricum]NAS17787.1 cobalt-factor II C(20)-methyltransferase [Clostridium butyricum]